MSHPIQFVSLGPGDPELITLKGWRQLKGADAVYCPETLTRDGRRLSRAADILLQLGVAEDAIRRFHLPMSKQRERALEAYDRVYAEARQLQARGKRVCIVAEGDAGFYSSIHYIYEKLQAAGVPVTHIAGIPAFIAAGALGGLHVASQEQRLTVMPGNATAEELEHLMADGGTVVIMKLSQCTDEMHRCIGLHPEYAYHYFENVGTPEEVYTCDTHCIAATKFPYFSLLIVQKAHPQ